MKSIYIFIIAAIIVAGAYLSYAFTTQNTASPSPTISDSQSFSPSSSPFLSENPAISISQSPSPSPSALASASPQATASVTPSRTPSPSASPLPDVEIEIEDSSFRPNSVTIKAGTTVVWKNRDSISHQVASNPHPLHSGLPGLVSPILAKDQRYSFKFTQIGTFGYHDHLNPLAAGGTIIVAP